MNLDGIRVLDLTQLLPGPYGTQLLADMGADVIKVEPPTGDPARHVQADPGWAGHVFSAVNSNKRSIAIDLKSDEGRAVFYDLVTESDVVFEQFRPGVTERLGVDYETLTDYREDLVYCSLTGYGQDGPYRDRVGHDLNYLAVAGLLDMTRPPDETNGGSGNGTARTEEGERDKTMPTENERGETATAERGPPTPPGYPVADMTGGLLAVTSILGALLERELGGEGTYLDVSMTDAVLSYGQVELAMADAGLDPRPGETPISGSLPWYGVYETADSEYVTLAALEPRFFETFCDEIGRPELTDYHLTSNSEERAWLREELAAVFADRTRSEWEDHLGDETMVAPVNSPAEALSDPHIRERDILAETDAGHRRVRFPVGESTDAGGQVPALGEHTDELLADCGRNPEDIQHLRETGAVR